MDKMWSYNIIYKILLIITHNLFNLLCVLYNMYVWLNNELKSLFNSHEVINDVQCIDNLFKKLDKMPQHLTIILGTEKPSFKDLINIIIWCTTSGIPFVSFYDHNGLLKEKEEEFYKMINSLSGLEYNNGYWTKKEAPFNGYKNGFTRKIRVKLYSLEDGQRDIVNKTRELLSLNKNSEDISIETLDNYIKQSNDNAPDPELVIYCGKLCSTYGFQPWQIRITEFFNLNTHHNITLDKFYNILKSYGNCEQRYGK